MSKVSLWLLFCKQPRRYQKEEEEKERYNDKEHIFKSKLSLLLFILFLSRVWTAVSLSMQIVQFFSPASGKLPKNYDPKATPDPERWLPMRERTYYRGKKKGKKKEQIGKGTQGATAGASAELWVFALHCWPRRGRKGGTEYQLWHQNYHVLTG